MSFAGLISSIYVLSLILAGIGFWIGYKLYKKSFGEKK
jgi:hypothetical protein